MSARGLLITAVAVCGVAAGSANADIVNGSFEDGMNGWTVVDNPAPFFPLDSYAAGTANTFGWPWDNTPTDGAFSMVTGWDGAAGNISISQDVLIDGGTLEFDYRAAWDTTFGATLPRDFSAIISGTGGGPVLDSMLFLSADPDTQVTDTGQLAGSMDVSAFLGQTVTLTFEWTVPELNTGPAQFDLDNVRLTPTPGALALLGLAGLCGRRRRRNA
ncbi:MAG: hypothetical protein ACYTF9_00850 [Planctomycetota bacterium]|jgi:MYXO-CTERM domain-containing protein